jgi:hypothetical protein
VCYILVAETPRDTLLERPARMARIILKCIILDKGLLMDIFEGGGDVQFAYKRRIS